MLRSELYANTGPETFSRIRARLCVCSNVNVSKSLVAFNSISISFKNIYKVFLNPRPDRYDRLCNYSESFVNGCRFALICFLPMNEGTKDQTNE